MTSIQKDSKPDILTYEQYSFERNMLTYGGAYSSFITYEEWKEIKRKKMP